MSRKQGDSYRTHTDHELNAYRARLDQKIREMEQREERWHHIGEGWVFTLKANILKNKNGGWKWNGWEVTGQRYEIRVFAGNCVIESNGNMYANGWNEKAWFFEGGEEARTAANAAWKEAKELAMNLGTSERVENRR